MIEKSSITSLPWKEGSWKVENHEYFTPKCRCETLQHSSPVLERGSDCPAGMAGQGAGYGTAQLESSHLLLHPSCDTPSSAQHRTMKWILQSPFSLVTSFNAAFKAIFSQQGNHFTSKGVDQLCLQLSLSCPESWLQASSAFLPYQGQRRFWRCWWSLTSSIKTLNYADTAHKLLNEGLPDRDVAWAEWLRGLPVPFPGSWRAATPGMLQGPCTSPRPPSARQGQHIPTGLGPCCGGVPVVQDLRGLALFSH